MKLLLKKITFGHMRENKCSYQMHIFVISLSTQYAPVGRCFCMVQPLRQSFRPKCTNIILQITVCHRRRVTAFTRLPRWRRRKTRLQVGQLLTMLQHMDHCYFWHANRYWIGLACDTVMFGNHASECGAHVFSGGRRVTLSKEAGDWGFRGGWLRFQTQLSRLLGVSI